MSLMDRVHERHVANRRVQVLLKHFKELVPQDMSVLDVGCGDGELTSELMHERPDLSLHGVEVLVREDCAVPITRFDGATLPYDDQSFDCVMFVDVLHHTEDPMILLREAARVAKHKIVVKDHLRQGLWSESTLRFMDRVGNARHGVSLPYNYWSPEQWDRGFEELGLTRDLWRTQLGLYWWPASLLFERSLHFVARLNIHGGHA